MWIETASPQDEGYYLCRANNGIGLGLTKIIYIGVNGKVPIFPLLIAWLLHFD